MNTSASCQNQWYSTTGLNGSTTGNITGIYDMSGGVWEYVTGFRNVTSGNIDCSNIPVSNTIDNNAKYFDVYDSSSTESSYSKRILGDATGEMGPVASSLISGWYGDFSEFISSTDYWFMRGGRSANGSIAGLFAFAGGNDAGFRLILAP